VSQQTGPLLYVQHIIQQIYSSISNFR